MVSKHTLGVSGRGVGKVLCLNKANVYNWIKKRKVTKKKIEKTSEHFELDELYWFIGRKGTSKTRENIYLITMISRNPCQIVGFDIAFDKSPERIQKIVDSSPKADFYYTDDYFNILMSFIPANTFVIYVLTILKV